MADIGTVLGGRYRLVELLGQGGMATIYRARDSQLERDVAVKLLRPEYGADPDFVARFRQEAQSAASLNHPNVVAVFDYGTDPAGPYIVMELVDGEDLASIVRRSGALPPRQAARLTAQVARALSSAHEHGIVHRDVKPGNVLVTRDGRVKVTDFGIARALSESALTLPGTTLGSVHYFSPEQARGELATEASDIYSLGIVLYELLTGRRPWEGDSAAAIATARLTGSVPSPSSVRSGIPAGLEAIDKKALAPRPGDRFGSATELADALDRWLAEDRAAAGAGAGAAAGAGAGAAAGAMAAAGGAGGLGAGAGSAALGVAGGVAAGALGASAAHGGQSGGAGVARANPGAQVPYPRDAYAGAGGSAAGGFAGAAAAGAGTRGPRSRVVDVEEADDGGRGGPWLWISALLALAVVALAGFLLFRLLSATGTPAPSAQVSVPNLVGLSFDAAQATANADGLQVVRGPSASSEEVADTVLTQDPAAGTTVATGSTITLTVSTGPGTTVVVPNLVGQTEANALNAIFAAGLQVGTRTEDFDPTIPEGSVISQDPPAGIVATKGLPVSYVVSKGPEPSPTPAPTPTPTPRPTPPPTPAPTPTTVRDYRCVPLALAEAQIQQDGFKVGNDGNAGASDIVVSQDPAPGTQALPGTKINLTATPAPPTCPAS